MDHIGDQSGDDEGGTGAVSPLEVPVQILKTEQVLDTHNEGGAAGQQAGKHRHHQQQQYDHEPGKEFSVNIPQMIPDDFRQIAPVIPE